jgi:hypothetical protein
MEVNIKRMALFHVPTGKWVAIGMADSLYGGAVDGVEEATLLPLDITLDSALEGVDMQFAERAVSNFELKVVELTYRVSNG